MEQDLAEVVRLITSESLDGNLRHLSLCQDASGQWMASWTDKHSAYNPSRGTHHGFAKEPITAMLCVLQASRYSDRSRKYNGKYLGPTPPKIVEDDEDIFA